MIVIVAVVQIYVVVVDSTSCFVNKHLKKERILGTPT